MRTRSRGDARAWARAGARQGPREVLRVRAWNARCTRAACALGHHDASHGACPGVPRDAARPGAPYPEMARAAARRRGGPGPSRRKRGPCGESRGSRPSRHSGHLGSRLRDLHRPRHRRTLSPREGAHRTASPLESGAARRELAARRDHPRRPRRRRDGTTPTAHGAPPRSPDPPGACCVPGDRLAGRGRLPPPASSDSRGDDPRDAARLGGNDVDGTLRPALSRELSAQSFCNQSRGGPYPRAGRGCVFAATWESRSFSSPAHRSAAARNCQPSQTRGGNRAWTARPPMPR